MRIHWYADATVSRSNYLLTVGQLLYEWLTESPADGRADGLICVNMVKR